MTSSQMELDAARLLLSKMGIAPADLLTEPVERPQVPTFADYIPVVARAVSAATAHSYSSYWRRLEAAWGSRRLDEPSPSEIKQLAEVSRAQAVVRRDSRGGRNAAENFIAAVRCLYRHAVADRILTEAENPALKVAKPRRLPSPRRALADHELAEINAAAAETGDDPYLDTLLLRLHTETACRRGGALGSFREPRRARRVGSGSNGMFRHRSMGPSARSRSSPAYRWGRSRCPVWSICWTAPLNFRPRWTPNFSGDKGVVTWLAFVGDAGPQFVGKGLFEIPKLASSPTKSTISRARGPKFRSRPASWKVLLSRLSAPIITSTVRSCSTRYFARCSALSLLSHV